jgi:hypothetical protein
MSANLAFTPLRKGPGADPRSPSTTVAAVVFAPPRMRAAPPPGPCPARGSRPRHFASRGPGGPARISDAFRRPSRRSSRGAARLQPFSLSDGKGPDCNPFPSPTPGGTASESFRLRARLISARALVSAVGSGAGWTSGS